MNAGNQTFSIIKKDCNSAVLQATTTLRSACDLVQKSFDLHSAIPAQLLPATSSVDTQMTTLVE